MFDGHRRTERSELNASRRHPQSAAPDSVVDPSGRPSINRPSRNDSVAVIGAGMAGLASAHYLREQGYQQVTVLEAGNRAGGQCLSVNFEGQVYELGAVFLTAAYRTVTKLAEQTGLKFSVPRGLAICDLRTGDLSSAAQAYSDFLVPGLVPEIFRFRRLAQRYLGDGSGLAGNWPEEWALPFGDFAKQNGFVRLSEILASPLYACGYGRMIELPTIYVMRLVGENIWSVLLSGLNLDTTRQLSQGWQGLVTAISAPLAVQFEVVVHGIDALPEQVSLRTSDGVKQFDHVINACPPAHIPHGTATRATSSLLSRVQYMQMETLLVRLEGQRPAQSIWFYPVPADGSICGINQWHDKTDVAVIYVNCARGESSISRENLARELTGLGLVLTEVLQRHSWQLFPHVGPNDLRTGYYHKLAAMQGLNRVYHTGQLFSQDPIEFVVRHAQAMVETYF